MIVSFNAAEHLPEEIEELRPGFAFASYGGEKWFIQADLVLDLESESLTIDPAAIAIDCLDDLDSFSPDGWNYPHRQMIPPETGQADFIDQVRGCIEVINHSNLLKVVPSRVKLQKLASDFDLAGAFLKLTEMYDNAFVSVVSTPELGTWLGATPEVLISIDEQKIFRTMSMAGTQLYNRDMPLHEVAWTQKEIEEQAIVSRYIINRFKEIRLREFVEVGPRTIRAANLVHLCSTYTVDTKATNFPDLGSTMLRLLHPTSAVCGMPKDLAQTQINAVEQHDRSFYAGYLGPVNFDKRTDLYVNLRCMELFKEAAALYAGVGVTTYSRPAAEWAETVLKCDTLLSVIGH
jgi:isochorismate synthase